jgi:peptidoglycan/LPS O-acetylase OafA/YrhL
VVHSGHARVLRHVFLLLVALTSDDDATILRAQPFVSLGTVSYSVYLLHMPVYYALELAVGERLLARAGKFVVVAIVLAAAYQSHRWIEIPFQRAIRESCARRARLRGADAVASPV